METRSKRLRILRVEFGFSQGDIAEQLNITRQYYARLERGEQVGRPELWLRMQELFGLSDGEAWRLMHGIEERH